MTTTLPPPECWQVPGHELLDHLSRGHDLDVWAAWSEERDCSCIVKMVRPDRVANDHSRERLMFEGRALSSLSHPHLVRGYELIERGDAVGPVLVLETLTGATLSAAIESDFPKGMHPEDVAQLGLQLCSVLHYLHGYEVLHLDLKPSNIVVCESGKAVLLDLSLAQAPGSCDPGMGTAEYMAPEQVVGSVVSTATDVWGLGGVLYRAMTGRRPFPRTDLARTLDDQVDLASLRRHAPVVRQLVTGCFEQRQEDRPNLPDVRRALQE